MRDYSAEDRRVREKLEKNTPRGTRADVAGTVNGLAANHAQREAPGLAAYGVLEARVLEIRAWVDAGEFDTAFRLLYLVADEAAQHDLNGDIAATAAEKGYAHGGGAARGRAAPLNDLSNQR